MYHTDNFYIAQRPFGWRSAPRSRVTSRPVRRSESDRTVADLDRFVYDRSTEGHQHLAFAAGLHSCMGQILAHQSADTIMTAVTERCKRIELVYNSIQHARQWKTTNLQLTF
jgi:hypothetical protein